MNRPDPTRVAKAYRRKLMARQGPRHPTLTRRRQKQLQRIYSGWRPLTSKDLLAIPEAKAYIIEAFYEGLGEYDIAKAFEEEIFGGWETDEDGYEVAPLTTTGPEVLRVMNSLGLQDVRGASKTAGEVRFIKDKGSDHNEWAWNQGPNEREITKDFVFNARYLKPLANVLRSSLMALGHATSAHNRFVKIKSRNVSPDGSLGGRGYIQKIPDMRRQIMNCVEVLSAMTDTIYDEMHAPHWSPMEDTLDPRDREEVKEIVQDVEEIKDDPEGWAEDQGDDLDDDDDDGGRRASVRRRMATFKAPFLARLAATTAKLRLVAEGDMSLAEEAHKEAAILIHALDPEAGVVAWDAHSTRISNLIQRHLASTENPNV